MSCKGFPDTLAAGIGIANFDLFFTRPPYYAGSIAASNSMNSPDSPFADRHLWIEVAEYLVAVVGVVALVWLISDDLGSPLWGGLTSIRLR
jgi:hypothetical protein